jgi:hypothetical protein
MWQLAGGYTFVPFVRMGLQPSSVIMCELSTLLKLSEQLRPQDLKSYNQLLNWYQQQVLTKYHVVHMLLNNGNNRVIRGTKYWYQTDTSSKLEQETV